MHISGALIHVQIYSKLYTLANLMRTYVANIIDSMEVLNFSELHAM